MLPSDFLIPESEEIHFRSIPGTSHSPTRSNPINSLRKPQQSALQIAVEFFFKFNSKCVMFNKKKFPQFPKFGVMFRRSEFFRSKTSKVEKQKSEFCASPMEHTSFNSSQRYLDSLFVETPHGIFQEGSLQGLH